MNFKDNYKAVLLNIGLFLVIILVASPPKLSVAYDGTTHFEITRQILNHYFKDVFYSEDQDQIEQGSRDEDIPGFEDTCSNLDLLPYSFEARYFNHFYDFQNRGNNGGSFKYLPFYSSAKEWALSSTKQSDWLLNVRLLCAYTNTQRYVDDFSFDSNIARYKNQETSRSLYGLGHVLHLLEDVTSVAHVRNDAHMPGDTDAAESYFKENMKFCVDSSDNLINCKDGGEHLFHNKEMKWFSYENRNNYFDELAHYSQTFFFSEGRLLGTIDSKDYTYQDEDSDILPECLNTLIEDNEIKPKTIETDSYIINGDTYLVRYGLDENCNRYPLASRKWGNIWDILTSTWSLRWSINTDFVLEENWKRLVVKAGQYGAGLIKLFYKEVDTTPPSVPINLTATAASSTQINLSWDAATDNVGVAGYKIYRGANEVADTPSTSYEDKGLTPSTEYWYTVIAYDVAGNRSMPSAPDSATTLPAPSAASWAKTYGGPGDDSANSVQQTSDGGYIIAGITLSFGHGSGDVYLIKVDSAGNEQWENYFGGTAVDYGTDVIQLQDGGFAILGITSSFGSARDRAYLIKTDASGNEQWERTYGGWDVTEGQSLQQTSDGGFIFLGRSTDTDPWLDFCLKKIDANGNEQWTKYFGRNLDDSGMDLKVTSDGGYILAGYTGVWSSDVQAWIIKTDSSGNKVWDTVWGGPDVGLNKGDAAYGVALTQDGGYIVTGSTYSYGAGDSDAFLLKLNSSGQVQWHRTYGGANYDWGRRVYQKPNGHFVIAGATEITIGNYQAWLVETDENGNDVWTKTYGGSGNDYANSVQQTSDGGYIIAGSTSSDGAGGSDVYLIKTDADGNVK